MRDIVIIAKRSANLDSGKLANKVCPYSPIQGDQTKALKQCSSAITQAGFLYEAIKARAVRLDQKSNDEHIQPLAGGLGLFAKLAEL